MPGRRKAERDRGSDEESSLETLSRLMATQIEQAKQEREAAKEERLALQSLLQQALQGHTPVSGQTTVDSSSIPAPDSAATARPKPPSAIAPCKLQGNVSLREFKVWRSAWTDYSELMLLKDQPIKMQLAHFRSCLSSEMRSTLSLTSLVFWMMTSLYLWKIF